MAIVPLWPLCVGFCCGPYAVNPEFRLWRLADAVFMGAVLYIYGLPVASHSLDGRSLWYQDYFHLLYARPSSSSNSCDQLRP